MGIKVKNTIDFKKKAETLTADLEKNMARALEETATKIVRDTQSGRDIEGQAMAKYTDAYKRHKTEKGRKANVDLTFTGRMLASITTKVEVVGNKIKGRIFFGSQTEVKKAEGNLRKRRFFGLSAEARKKLIDKVMKRK